MAAAVIRTMASPRAPPGTAACTQVQNSLAGERAQLASDITIAKWYPVLNLGVAFRF